MSGPSGDRTHDLRVISTTLYRLSYTTFLIYLLNNYVLNGCRIQTKSELLMKMQTIVMPIIKNISRPIKIYIWNWISWHHKVCFTIFKIIFWVTNRSPKYITKTHDNPKKTPTARNLLSSSPRASRQARQCRHLPAVWHFVYCFFSFLCHAAFSAEKPP